jgi:outer membrane protein assembly factor BamA
MVTVYAERHTEFGAYLRAAVGGELALTYELAPRSQLRGAYALAFGKTIATPATFCALLDVCDLDDQAIFQGRRRRSVVSLAFSRDRTNALVDPTSGSTFIAEVRWSPAQLGSDRFVRFSRITTGYTAHVPLGRTGAAAGRVFNWRVSAGVTLAPIEQFASGPRRYAPPEERLYLGGSNTVRGFSEKQLGPIVRVIGADSAIQTSATGGMVMALANAELRMPFTAFGLRLFGAFFADGGIVGEGTKLDFGDWRVTPGAGLRIPSILGPIRIDVAFNPSRARAGPLYRLVGSQLELVNPRFRPRLRFIDRLRLHLAIGQAF